MQIQLKKPELEKFIDDRVTAGHFPTRDAAIEAAVEQMRIDSEFDGLTEEDCKAISESNAQIDRGEFVEFDTFAAEMKKKYNVKCFR